MNYAFIKKISAYFIRELKTLRGWKFCSKKKRSKIEIYKFSVSNSAVSMQPKLRT